MIRVSRHPSRGTTHGEWASGTQEHQGSLTSHIEAEGVYNHHRLDQLFPLSVSHTLDKECFLLLRTPFKHATFFGR